MSYQVLARKWRPKTFAELSGQEHVVTALTNALTSGRLHHAYLLTGTRGVGKTTIARILAKSLNCESGVTAAACGACAACTAIDAGRFIDLIELDAASNTGIDNMREILDNARYAPTVGRYKVYLIDEVHMLSKAAFNSMLKTLEEPPDHVKFVLATTDPQKIPVTVLSRCLQFNLKPLPAHVIGERIGYILQQEAIPFEAGGVAVIARSARGSLRDGLSLLDQAVACGAGEVSEHVVRMMLGAVERDYIYRLVDALVASDGPVLLAECDSLLALGVAPGSALEELAALFHRVAVAQVVPGASAGYDDTDRVSGYATRLTPEGVQLAYQICAQGREDLTLAPDEAMGFAMTLLRLLAFEPAGRVQPASTPATGYRAAAAVELARSQAPAIDTAPASTQAASRPAHAPAATESVPPAKPLATLPTDAAAWPAFVAMLKLSGMPAQLAAQTELKAVDGLVLTLALPVAHKHLADRGYADKLKLALQQATGRKWLLAFEVGAETDVSLAASERRSRADAKTLGEAAFRNEPFVRDLLATFDGKVNLETIARIAREDGK